MVKWSQQIKNRYQFSWWKYVMTKWMNGEFLISQLINGDMVELQGNIKSKKMHIITCNYRTSPIFDLIGCNSKHWRLYNYILYVHSYLFGGFFIQFKFTIKMKFLKSYLSVILIYLVKTSLPHIFDILMLTECMTLDGIYFC